MMTSVLLVLAMGCGNKETAEPREQAKAASKPVLPDSNIGQPKFDPTKHERFLWEFETGARVSSSPAISSDGRVYGGSWDNKLYAIKTESLGPAKSPWPMFGQNARLTGRTK